ncbi:hypothetical protein BT69DRAFT_574178 [Atractiella rhizophila]|nr:hypothetical protein BT69DRAFT_574178 [Atractiella rhizophila]
MEPAEFNKILHILPAQISIIRITDQRSVDLENLPIFLADHPHVSSLTFNVSYLEGQLNRTQTFPQSRVIELSISCKAIALSVILRLLSYFPSLRELSLDVSINTDADMSILDEFFPLPLLRKATIKIPSPSSFTTADRLRIESIFASAPSLEYLTLGGECLDRSIFQKIPRSVRHLGVWLHPNLPFSLLGPTSWKELLDDETFLPDLRSFVVLAEVSLRFGTDLSIKYSQVFDECKRDCVVDFQIVR